MFVIQFFHQGDRYVVLPFGHLLVERRRFRPQQNPDVFPRRTPHAENFVIEDLAYDWFDQEHSSFLKLN